MSRRHVVQQPTPMLDQLTRESQFWLQPRQQQEQQLTPLESHLLRQADAILGPVICYYLLPVPWKSQRITM